MIEEVLEDEEIFIYRALTEQLLNMPNPKANEEASQKMPLLGPVDDRQIEVIVDVETSVNSAGKNHEDPRNKIQENDQRSNLILQNLNNEHNKDKEQPTFNYIQIGWQTENCH